MPTATRAFPAQIRSVVIAVKLWVSVLLCSDDKKKKSKLWQVFYASPLFFDQQHAIFFNLRIYIYTKRYDSKCIVLSTLTWNAAPVSSQNIRFVQNFLISNTSHYIVYYAIRRRRYAHWKIRSESYTTQTHRTVITDKQITNNTTIKIHVRVVCSAFPLS